MAWWFPAAASGGIVLDAHRKSHEIEGSTEGEQTDYQVPITVHYGEGAEYFAENGVDDPLYVVNYPRAVYYNGKTYMVWQGDAGYDPYIIAYDHATDTYSDAVKVGTNPLSSDYHGAPIILIDNSGYIHVFYGCHSSNLKYAKSNNPENITAWTAQADPTTLCTYPNVIPDNGSIHLIYRHSTGAWNGNLAYRLSADNGASWGAKTTIVEVDDEANDSIYAYQPQLDGTKLHIIWRYHSPGGGHENVYHAYLELSDGHMYSIDGTDLGTSITKAEADANCLVVTSGIYIMSHMALRIDGDGYPYIIYAIETDTAWDYRFTRWNGANWVASETIAETDDNGNSADFILHSSTSITAFLIGSGVAGRGGDIVKWSWNGTSWSEVKTILSEADAGMPLISPKVVVNYDEELQFIFTEYGGADVTGLKVYASDGDSLVLDKDKGEDVYCNEKCKTDFGDIRFTESDGVTELDYWMEQKVDSDYAIFWVKIPTIPADPDSVTIYVYYGKDDATTTSNGVNTAFDAMFDDFESYVVDDPIPTDGIWDTNDAVCKNDPDAEGHGKTAYLTKAAAQGLLPTDAFTKLYPIAVRFWIRRTSNVLRDGYMYLWEDATLITTAWWNNGEHEYYDTAFKSFVPACISTLQTWELWELRVYSADFHVINDGLDCDGAIRNAVTVGINKLDLRCGAALVTGAFYYDDLFIRKFVDPEPAHGDWGSEESVVWPF